MIRALFRFERVWARAALDAIYPSAASKDLPVGISAFDVDSFFDDLFLRLPLVTALGLRAAIWMVALAPLFVLHRLSTIARLGSGDRNLLILRLLGSQRYAVRQLVMALKATGGIFYGGAPQIRERVLHPQGRDSGRDSGRVKTRLPMLPPAPEASIRGRHV
jgi:hypothetical protein